MQVYIIENCANINVYVYIYMYVYIYIYTYVYEYKYTYIYIYCIYICIFAVLFLNCLHDLPTLNGDYIIYDISADVDVCIATIYI